MPARAAGRAVELGGVDFRPALFTGQEQWSLHSSGTVHHVVSLLDFTLESWRWRIFVLTQLCI